MAEVVSEKKSIVEIPKRLFDELGINKKNISRNRQIARTHCSKKGYWLLLDESSGSYSVELSIFWSKKAAINRFGTNLLRIYAGKGFITSIKTGKSTTGMVVLTELSDTIDVTYPWRIEYIAKVLTRLSELIRSGEYDIEVMPDPPEIPPG